MIIKGAFPVRWKAKDGADGVGVTINSTVIRWAVSTSGTTRPTTGWQTSVPEVSNGNYLWTWTYVLYSDGTETNTYSVSRMGIDGKGIESSVIKYCQKAEYVSPDSIAESDWGAFPSELTDGYWLYTRTVITYSSKETTTSYSVSQVGVGSYYAGVAEYYAAGESADAAPDGAIKPGTYPDGGLPSTSWKQERPTLTAATPYLWNFEVSADSRGNRYVTEAVCIGNFAKGIVSIVESYAISAYSAPDKSGASYPSDIAEADWTDEAHDAAPTQEKRYQWNRTVTTYNDGTTDTIYHVSAVCGLDGKGAIYLDLDNENDSMLYDGAGNLLSGSVTSAMTLYANGEAVSPSPTFSISVKSSTVSATISGNVLTVSGMTSDSGYVVVECTYQSVKYTARMTLKRLVGVDKYEIMPDRTAVTYNETTDTFDNSTIQVYVRRTAANGTPDTLAYLTTYDLTLKLYPNGVATNATTLEYSSSYGAIVDVDSSWTSFSLVLLQGTTEVDRETIPINRVKDGSRGPGGIILDLDNENDSMLYDEAGTLLSGSATSQATLYEGGEKVSSGVTYSKGDTSGCTATVSSSGKVTVTDMSSSSGYVTVEATYNGATYTARFTLKKLRGVDKYELVCTPSGVTYNQSTGALSASSVAIRIYRTSQVSDGSVERVNISSLPTGYALTYSVDASTAETSLAYSNGVAGMPVSGSYDQYVVRLKNAAGLVLDSETVPISKTVNGSGEAGPAAKSIYKATFVQPSAPTGSAPSGWTDTPPVQTAVSVEAQGDWLRDADGFYRAPNIGSGQYSIVTLRFVTTEASQKVYLRVTAQMGSNDNIYVGSVDAPSATTNYYKYYNASSVDSGDLTLTVASAGVHHILIRYYHGSADAMEYVKVGFGNIPVWQSNAATYDADGDVETWTAPFRITQDAATGTTEQHANLIRQSGFISTLMDKWFTANGATTTGLEGKNAYKGTPVIGNEQTELLQQYVHEPGENEALAANTWYTLSFYAKADAYIALTVSETGSTAVFGAKSFYLLAGVKVTITCYGYVSDTSYTRLLYSVYGPDGSTVASAYTTSGYLTAKTITFTPTETGLHTLSGRLYMASGSTNTSTAYTAYISDYQLDRGRQMHVYLYPNVKPEVQSTYTAIDVNAGRYANGVLVGTTSPTDNARSFQLTEVWTRYSLTFKTRTYLPTAAKQQLLFRMAASSNGTYICMPKLEQGMLATPYVAHEDDVAAKAAAETGFPNFRGQWVDAPSPSYRWDETVRDYVGYYINEEWKYYFVKRKGMTVPDGTPPTAGGNTYWEEGNVVQNIITNTAVVDNAQIGGFLTSNSIFKSLNGSLTLDGIKGLIKLLHENYTWQVLEDGRQVLGDYTDDTAKGRHIQLDPASREIRVYDDSGVCVTSINGQTVGGLSELFGETSQGDLSIDSAGEQGSITVGNHGSSSIVNTDSVLKTISTLTTASSARIGLSGTLNVTRNTASNTAAARIEVVTYADSTKGKILQSVTVVSLVASKNTLETKTFSDAGVQVPAGYHVVSAHCYATVGAGQTPTSTTAGWYVSGGTYASDFYLSRLFANGMAYGSSVNDFFTAMNIGGKMFLKAVTLNAANPLCGFVLDPFGFRTIYKTHEFRNVVTLGVGRIYINGSSTILTKFVSGLYSSAGSPTVSSPPPSPSTGDTTGRVQLNFPTTWQDIIADTNRLVINVNGYSGNSGKIVMTGIDVIAATYCILMTGNDNSPDDDKMVNFEVRYVV